MSGEIGSLTFDELHAIVRANRGDELRAAGEGWARAADGLDRQADTLAAGLPTLEQAWDSAAGRAHTDEVRALVARMRETADVARYNHAQMLAAADATDAAIRQLALVSDAESAERDEGARDVMDALNETYANVAARLTEPLVDAGDVGSPLIATMVLSAVAGADLMVPSTPPSESPSALPSESPSVPPAVSPKGQGRESNADISDDRALGDHPYTSDIDIDAELPDAVSSEQTPARRSYGTRSRGQGQRFPATPRLAVAPVLPTPVPSTRPASPVPSPSATRPRPESSGFSPAASGPPAAPRPTGASRRAAEETYLDMRGHHVHIRWRGGEPVEPHP